MTASPSNQAGLRLWTWGAGLISLAIAGAYGYSGVFSRFSRYDDEGFLMLCIRHLLEGVPLYDRVPGAYGPFYYFYQWLLHAPGCMPLTHDAVGVLCVIHWLAAASLLAVAAGKLTRSFAVGLFVFMQATLHLRYLANEPGSPQELVAILLACSALAAAMAPTGRATLVLLGAIGAALSLTKINVGAFFGLGLLLALACQARFFESRKAKLWVLLVLSSALPFLLMRAHLTEGWAIGYAAQAGAAVMAAGAAAWVFQPKRDVGAREVSGVAWGFAAATALVVLFPLAKGTSWSGLLQGVLIGPAKLPGIFSVPLKIQSNVWSSLGALVVAALAIRGGGRFGPLLVAAKLMYGFVGALAFTLDAPRQLAYLAPWGWLLLAPARPMADWEQRGSFPRTFLCLLAAWQSLHAYPVAGTQVALATFSSILVYTVCLHDALLALISGSGVADRFGLLNPKTRGLLEGLGLAALVYLFAVSWCAVGPTVQYYIEMKPLALPGAHRVRLPPSQAEPYQQVARYLEAHCDTFITYPGLNSLYFWTSKRPPTDWILNGEGLPMGDAADAQVIEALRKAERSRVVVDELQADKLVRGGATNQGPLIHFIRNGCHEVARAGPFRILAPTAAKE